MVDVEQRQAQGFLLAPGTGTGGADLGVGQHQVGRVDLGQVQRLGTRQRKAQGSRPTQPARQHLHVAGSSSTSRREGRTFAA